MPTSDSPYRYVWTFSYPAGLSVNHQYVRTRTGVRLSSAALSWREQTIVQIRQEAQQTGWPLELPPGPLAFLLDAYPPNGRTRDPDNLLKLAQDSVMAAFGANDARVKHCCSTMHEPSPQNPRLVVRLKQWPLE